MRRTPCGRCVVAAVMALVSADSRIAELLAELQRLLGHTQVWRRGRTEGLSRFAASREVSAWLRGRAEALAVWVCASSRGFGAALMGAGLALRTRRRSRGAGVCAVDAVTGGGRAPGWGSGLGGCASSPRREPAALQEERSRSEHNLINIQKTHERMQTENKSESGAGRSGWRREPEGRCGAGLRGEAGFWGGSGVMRRGRGRGKGAGFEERGGVG